MPPIVRILLVAGVLASGLGIASLFKKPPAADFVMSRDTAAARHPDAPQIVLGPAQSGYGLAPPGPLDIAPPSVALTDGSRSGPNAAASYDRPPPMLPLRSPLSGGPDASAGQRPEASAAPKVESREPKSPVDDEPGETIALPARHRIVDGDTLESIAQRYLGDRARWSDVYQHNRDVLLVPGALPIGKELKIPSRQSLAAAASELPLVPLRRVGP